MLFRFGGKLFIHDLDSETSVSFSMNLSFPRRALTASLALAAVILAVVLILRGRADDRTTTPEPSSREPIRPHQRSKAPEDRQSSRDRTTKKSEGDGRVEEAYKEDTYESRLARWAVKPYSPEKLRLLAEHPPENKQEFSELILRAAAEKDPDFKYLLDRKELREDGYMHMALVAYDYAVNGNRAALESILDSQVKHEPSWDTNEVWALGGIDEWNLTKKALEARIISGDGSSGDARYAFWLKRRILFPNNADFPKDYQRFQEELYENQKISERSAPQPPPVKRED